jgi:hypothetical protein
MQARKQGLLFLTVLCVSVCAEAVGPTATAQFFVQDLETHKRTPALEARLDQYVCLSIEARLVPDGEHTLQLTIYDGEGREVHKSAVRRNATNESLERLTCTGFDEDYDAAGTWWYVVELDGEPLVSESIEIRPID